MRDYDNVDVTLDNDVLTIALDRPDQLNAANGELHEELSRVFREPSQTDARVVVLTGKGKAFSAGGDFNWMQETVDDPNKWNEQTMGEAQRILRDLVQIEQPVIARVNGDAVGLGATLALFCDIVVATEDARFGDPHVNVGLVAGDGGAVIWPLLTGLNTAKEMLLTGELLAAEEAKDLGLINRVVPAEELDRTVDELVDQLASQPQVALRYTKHALNQWLDFAMTLTMRDSLALEGLSIVHPDHGEAVDALINRRQPDFPSARSKEE